MSPSASGKRKEEVSRYEWIVGALGALIFLFLLTYFIRQAILPAEPVRIDARIDSVGTSRAGEYIAYFTASNSGRSSASEVRLAATLQLPTDSVAADATIARIAAGSRQSGAFLFPGHPGRGDVRIRVVSYQTP